MKPVLHLHRFVEQREGSRQAVGIAGILFAAFSNRLWSHYDDSGTETVEFSFHDLRGFSGTLDRLSGAVHGRRSTAKETRRIPLSAAVRKIGLTIPK